MEEDIKTIHQLSCFMGHPACAKEGGRYRGYHETLQLVNSFECLLPKAVPHIKDIL